MQPPKVAGKMLFSVQRVRTRTMADAAEGREPCAKWPADNIHICKEDERCMNVAKLYGVDAALLVQKNKRTWRALNQTAPLKEGTSLVLPLPGDSHEQTGRHALACTRVCQHEVLL